MFLSVFFLILLNFVLFIFLQLLDYVTTTMFFSDKNVDSNLISWNRVVLLHGKWLVKNCSVCVVRRCNRSRVSTNRFRTVCMLTFRTPRDRKNLAVQSSCAEAVNQTVKSVGQSSFLEKRLQW